MTVTKPKEKENQGHDDFLEGLTDNLTIAETYILGACMRDGTLMAQVAEVLREMDFPTVKWRACWWAMLDLYQQGESLEPALVADRLYQVRRLKTCTYHDVLNLWLLHPSGANLRHHVEVLREVSLRRELEATAGAIAQSAGRPEGPVQEAIAAAEKDMRDLVDRAVPDTLAPAAAAVQEVYARLDGASARQPGLPTPWQEADRVTGGLQPGELIVIAARPGVGKTALACNLAVEIATRQGRGVFFASLEQSRRELAERMLCNLARVDGQKVRLCLLGKFESQQFADSGHVLSGAPLWIDDRPAQGLLRIGANARRLRAKLGLIIVDYLQLVEPLDRKEARHEQVSEIAKKLRQLSRELTVPVVALAQLNRSVEENGRRRPRLSDLRESGGIEAAADTVWLLHRAEERGQSPTPIEVHIAKQRNGPVGEFVLNYFPQWLLFQSMSEMEIMRRTHDCRETNAKPHS
jgi:replicative DNA helicase